MIQKSRSSFIYANRKNNSNLLTQNSHPTSLHEKPFNTEESQEKKLLQTVQKLQLNFRKNPEIFENFRAKFPKIQPLGVLPRSNEEKNSASTQTTNPVSREGMENDDLMSSKNNTMVSKNLYFKRLSLFYFQAREKCIKSFI
jgi:hypothetical protein